MPIEEKTFKSSGNNKISDVILEFLEKNRENAYTLRELKEHIAKDHDGWMIHMELTSLIWSGKVEYRDIYASDGKLVRYFRLNDSKK